MSQPSYQALYQAVVALTQNQVHATSSYLDIEQLIARGAPVNPTQADEHSLVLPLIVAFKNHGERVLPHLRLLVEAGANPMLMGVFNPQMVEKEDEVADYLLTAMFRAEGKGHPMRAEDGRNPLHVLMQARDWTSCPTSARWMEERYHQAWVQGMDARGNTPMHALWQAAYDFVESHTEQAVVFDDRAWSEARALIQHGGTIEHIPGAAGRPAADSLLETVAIGLHVPGPYQSLLQQAHAAVEAYRIEIATPRPTASPAGPRL